MAFRKFRDTYMKEDENLKQEVEKYYNVAPQICKAIDAKGEAAAKMEYSWIWDNFLSLAYEALENKKFDTAYEIYKNMVLKLERIYITNI